MDDPRTLSVERENGAPTVAIASLGCKVNQCEAGALGELFRRHGYRLVSFEEQADVYVVHTCTVTHLSDRKCRQMIRRALRNNPRATVAVSGCYAQVAPEEVAAIPGVKVVVGTRERSRLVELVQRAASEGPLSLVAPWVNPEPFEEMPVAGGNRVRAFIRIQEGCQEFCAYCIVPLARGPIRSRPPAAVRAEVERLVRAGYREVVLTGVNLGAYGQDLEKGSCLAKLLGELVGVPGLGRLRLSSVEPHYFTTELVAVVTSDHRICPHWHIPLQSGDSEILRRMGRGYTTENYAALVDRLRQKRPEAAITTDIIVGFPGEDDSSFERSFAFVKTMGFSRLHVFPYSPRRGTPAASLPGQVKAEVKAARGRRLRELGRKLAEAYAGRFLGQELMVVVEKEVEGRAGYVEGHSENYLIVGLPGGQGLVGRLVRTRIRRRTGERLEGEPVGEAL